MHQWKANKYLMVFADCILVKGSQRALIADLTRGKYHFIPNTLAEMLIENMGKTKESIIENYGSENTETIEEYIGYLEEKEFIFWCDEDKITLFPPIDLTWEWPAHITNAIFDIDENSNFNFEDIVKQLEPLNCQDIQIRAYSFKDLAFWDNWLTHTLEARMRSIEIISPFHSSIEMKEVEELTKKHLRIRSIIFHSAPKFEIIKQDSNMGMIATITDKVDNNSHCGLVHWNYFNTNIKLFTEAQKHNTCLNRKISIDVNGEIKNCPSMAKSYGNIKDTTLQEAIGKPGFKDMWYINKDQVNVCKDCEFRYICTDCRAYIENPEDIYSKPLKCGYNPYTAEWEEWSTNPLKQKAIEHYGMQELVKK
jgi:SPASM domain peptide maturase of grasp-with-spasm system